MTADHRLAFLYPGQGSQHIGMGAAAFSQLAAARAVFEEADDALGFALSRLCFEGDDEELRKTENTQPAILTVSVALQRALASRGVEARWMAGHSLGEYSALVAAGSLELPAALRLVRNRGSYMQEAVPEGQGAMAAILGLDDAAVERVCEDVADGGAAVVEPANYNSPGQVVVAGGFDAVGRAVDLAKARGARRAMMLNVSAPFHCRLMGPAAERLAEDLEALDFRDPQVPVFCNVDATPLTRGQQVAAALRRQVTSPVRWVDDLRAMQAAGADHYVEVGPGKVLSGLARRTLEPVTVSSVQGPDDIEALLTILAAP